MTCGGMGDTGGVFCACDDSHANAARNNAAAANLATSYPAPERAATRGILFMKYLNAPPVSKLGLTSPKLADLGIPP
jgi:hypothetical protein